MYKAFVVFVFLLSGLSSLGSSHQPLHQVLGQAAPPKDQSLRTTTNQTNPAVPTSTDPNQSPKSLYEEGVKRVEMGQVSEAVERFQQAVKLDPEYAEAYSALGRAFFKLRQWENASVNVRRAIALRAKQRETQNPLHNHRGNTPSPIPSGSKPRTLNENLKGVTPSATHTGNKPQTPTKNATAAKTPHVVSLATNPPSKPPQQTNRSAGTTTFNARPEMAQLRRIEPGIATNTEQSNKLSPGAVGGNAAMKTPSGPSVSVQPNEQRRAAPTAKPANLIIANTVKLTSFTKVRPLKLIPPAPKAVQLSVTRAPQLTQLNSDEGDALAAKQKPANLPMGMSVTLSAFAEAKRVVPVSPKRPTNEVSLTNIYRVGPKDVLDIRLNNSQPMQETVFVVTPSGLLEHPKLSGPLPVNGLTVEEIAAKLENHLKTQVLIENPKVSVEVFDYASHAIVVNGLVKAPGTKKLKSEATPLLIVLAEAQPLPEAGRVTIVRNNQTQILEAELHTTDIKVLVQPGDIVTVHPNTTQFVYVGGRVRFPGKKTYRYGFTLVQAILAAGGEPTKSKVAEISRGDDQGSLVRTRVDLEAIELGGVADPVLRPGDRIMVLR